MAIGFIKLFIGWKCTVTLERAACQLTQNKDSHKLKTKIRRLYDIANVFLALGVIQKAYLPNRKPAFSWTGLEGLNKIILELKSLPPSQNQSKPQKKMLEKAPNFNQVYCQNSGFRSKTKQSYLFQ